MSARLGVSAEFRINYLVREAVCSNDRVRHQLPPDGTHQLFGIGAKVDVPASLSAFTTAAAHRRGAGRTFIRWCEAEGSSDISS